MAHEVAKIIASSVDKDEVLSSLAERRSEFQTAGLNSTEDVVLEVVDYLVGWCSPCMRLWDRPKGGDWTPCP